MRYGGYNSIKQFTIVGTDNIYETKDNVPGDLLECKNGKPSLIQFSFDSIRKIHIISGLSWLNMGSYHRVYGPAKIDYILPEKFRYDWFHNDKNVTNIVEEWLKENNMNWRKMDEEDYNRMWFEIL